MGLARFSDEFREADPELAARAWSLAIVLAAEHGWTPSEAARLL